MQYLYNDYKGTKYLSTLPSIIPQLCRAFNRYSDCDKKRSEPCKETKQNTQKA